LAIKAVSSEEFVALADSYPVLDVRSPGEFNHAHIPGAISFPLFDDEERAQVGTMYKQQSREDAIKLGLDFFGPKMRKMVESAEIISGTGHTPSDKCILVHCWRGGMRSAGVAWLLELYGFKVYTLNGGYKSFRNWVLNQFDKPYHFSVLGGNTGSGKTYIVHELEKLGHTAIDLEGLASHKGSAFGNIGMPDQPSQEMFENMLAFELYSKASQGKSLWLEDESQRIGHVNIPAALWKSMLKSKVYYLDIPFEERLHFIVQEYGKLDKDRLLNAISRIKKRLGDLETRNAIRYLMEDNVKDSFRILLKYYDRFYLKSLQRKENFDEVLIPVTCEKVDTTFNTLKLLSSLQKEQI
jgi:tRNA 2-selenouridine synthase